MSNSSDYVPVRSSNPEHYPYYGYGGGSGVSSGVGIHDIIKARPSRCQASPAFQNSWNESGRGASQSIPRPMYNGFRQMRPRHPHPLRHQRPQVQPHGGYNSRFQTSQPHYSRFNHPEQQHSPGPGRFGNFRHQQHHNFNGNIPQQFAMGNQRGFSRGGHGNRGRGGVKPNNYTMESSTKHRGSFYCDTCDKSCLDQGSFDEHKAEHMTCKLDGCTFTAQPKVILKHIQMQHSTNLFFRVKGYDSPETVAKWRQERKENFPTPENIAKKRATNTEKASRGERITNTRKHPSVSTPVFRYSIDAALEKLQRPRISEGPRTSAFSDSLIARNLRANKSEVVLLENYYSVVKINEQGKLVGKRLALWKSGPAEEADEDSDTGSKANENSEAADEFDITDDEVDDNTTEFVPEPEIPKCLNNKLIELEPKSPDQGLEDEDKGDRASSVGEASRHVKPNSGGLSALVSYTSDSNSPAESDLEDGEVDDEGKDSDQDAELPLEIPFGKQETSPGPGASPSSSGLLPDNQVIPQSPEKGAEFSFPAKTSARNPKKRKQPKREMDLVPRRKAARVLSRPPTLLRRLLNDEICKERNYIFQTCRYLVKNKFLDKEKTTEESQGTQVTYPDVVSSFSSNKSEKDS